MTAVSPIPFRSLSAYADSDALACNVMRWTNESTTTVCYLFAPAGGEPGWHVHADNGCSVFFAVKHSMADALDLICALLVDTSAQK